MRVNYQKSFYNAAKAVYKISNGLDNLSFPLDILEIISQDQRIKLMTFNEFSNKTHTPHFQISSIFGSEDAFHIRKGNKALIIYNNSLPMNRLRFTLAHEYGHFVMGHTGINLNEHFTYEDFYRRKAEEYEANSFASCLLFPLHIRYKYFNCLNTYKTSEIFQISLQASEIALKVIKTHMDSGLDDYMSSNENLHPKNYLLFLKESLDSHMDYINEFNYIYDLPI
ncbi:ImmA/IrrE family metallo-endopeptidase [Staphylococcus hominis]|uniref:ImmA/IrrE family metallo-endopeptidase n=1 Tax=Staphylococcus hominis TaxID=1290 RepID=UPI0031BB1FCF